VEGPEKEGYLGQRSKFFAKGLPFYPVPLEAEAREARVEGVGRKEPQAQAYSETLVER